MNLFRWFFKSDKNELPSFIDNLELNENEKQLIKEFSKLKNDKRIRKIIVCGDSGELQYYPLLKYSIMHDNDLDVKMAALKRIHLFKNHPDVFPMLKELNDHFNTRVLEPYYSMALSKTGIISLKEFEERLTTIK